MDHPSRVRRRLTRMGSVVAFYFLAGILLSVLVAFGLSRVVDVRLATPASAEFAVEDQTWSVDRWERTGAAQLLSIRQVRLNWSPRQATGPPDTPMPGDQVTAWASARPDAPGDWLELGYPTAVLPRSVQVYESCSPGAICRVTAFKPDGTEVSAWQGTDPTPTSAASGVSDIPLTVPFPTDRIRIYLESEKVPGWNEIDAAALIAADGQSQWANSARASSFYGSGSVGSPSATSPAPDEFVPRWSGMDHPGPALRDGLANDEYRLADARGWPMLAMYSQRTIPATVAGAMGLSASGSTYTTSYPVSPRGAWLPGVSPIPSPADVTPVPLHPIWLGLAVDGVVFGAALLLLRWLLTAPRRVIVELSRLRHGRCIACGYDLGYDFVRGCPECGWRRSPGACAPYRNGDATHDDKGAGIYEDPASRPAHR